MLSISRFPCFWPLSVEIYANTLYPPLVTYTDTCDHLYLYKAKRTFTVSLPMLMVENSGPFQPLPLAPIPVGQTGSPHLP